MMMDDDGGRRYVVSFNCIVANYSATHAEHLWASIFPRFPDIHGPTSSITTYYYNY
jgi:hypothetical protein